MHQCLELAAKGLDNVAPNPMVGCVIVHDNKIIGSGFHEEYGKAHAEVNAIKSVSDKTLLKKSTLYVNLEPCSHHGKTPPCSDLIIENKIPYVVIGNMDTNPLVQGKGMGKLIKAGIDVKIGVLDNECRELNKRFFTLQEKKRPYVILKWAKTRDGFLSSGLRVLGSELKNRKPEPISNKESHKLSHQWRTEEQVIMVGTNTAITDNPQLTARLVKGKNPLRVVIDRELKTPADYHLFDDSTPTLVFTGKKKEKSSNTEYVVIDFKKSVSAQILNELYHRNKSSLIVEGGTETINYFIKENLWDEARIFTSPSLLKEGIKAPELPEGKKCIEEKNIENDELRIYRNE